MQPGFDGTPETFPLASKFPIKLVGVDELLLRQTFEVELKLKVRYVPLGGTELNRLTDSGTEVVPTITVGSGDGGATVDVNPF